MRVCNFTSRFPINILVTPSKAFTWESPLLMNGNSYSGCIMLLPCSSATARHLEQTALEMGTWKKGYECKGIWHQTSCPHAKIKDPRKQWMQSSSVAWILLYKDPGDSIEKLTSPYYLPHLAQHGISSPNLRKDHGFIQSWENISYSYREIMVILLQKLPETL